MTEQETQEQRTAAEGRAALVVAFHAIPNGDIVRAEWFCELLQAAVRGGMSLEDARGKLVEEWK